MAAHVTLNPTTTPGTDQATSRNRPQRPHATTVVLAPGQGVKAKRFFVADDTASQTDRRRNTLFPGTYYDEQGDAHPALLKIYDRDDTWRAESQIIAAASERGVGPRLFESAASDLISRGRYQLPHDMTLSPDTRTLCIENVGVDLWHVLHGQAPIPRFDEGATATTISYKDWKPAQRDTFASKVLYDLCWQLNALLSPAAASALPIYHHDIKLENICVAAWGPAVTDIRATLIDFETSDSHADTAGAHGETRSYARMLPGCEKDACAYDIGCMALVFEQLSQGRPFGSKATHRIDQFSTLRTADCFWYENRTPQVNLENLTKLISSLAKELSLMRLNTYLKKNAIDDRSRVSALVHQRERCDMKDIIDISAYLARQRVAQVKRHVSIALIADEGCERYSASIADFLSTVSADYRKQGTVITVRTVMADQDSETNQHDLDDALTSNTLAMVLLGEETTARTEALLQAIKECASIEAPGKKPPATISTWIRVPLDMSEEEAPLTKLCEQVLGTERARTMRQTYRTHADPCLYLGMLLGGVELSSTSDQALVGVAALDITETILYRETVGTTERALERAQSLLEQATGNPDEVANNVELSQRLRDSAQADLEEQRDNLRETFARISYLYGSRMSTADDEDISHAETALAQGAPITALRALAPLDIDSIARSYQKEFLRLSAQAQRTLKKQLMRAVAMQELPVSPLTLNLVDRELKRAANFETKREIASLGANMGACEVYGVFLFTQRNKYKDSREWLNEAISSYRRLTVTDSAIYMRRMARALAARGVCELREGEPYTSRYAADTFEELDRLLDDIEPDPVADRESESFGSPPFDVYTLRATVRSGKGKIANHQGDTTRAIDYLQDAIAQQQRAEPGSRTDLALANLYNELGLCLALAAKKSEQPEEAAFRLGAQAYQAFQAALEHFKLAPDQNRHAQSVAYTYLNIARLYDHFGYAQKAAEEQHTSLELTRHLYQGNTWRYASNLDKALTFSIILDQKAEKAARAAGREQEADTLRGRAQQEEEELETRRRGQYRIPTNDKLFISTDVELASNLAMTEHLHDQALQIINDAVSRAEEVLKLANRKELELTAEEREPYEHAVADARAAHARICAKIPLTDALAQAHEDLERALELERGSLKATPRQQLKTKLNNMALYLDERTLVELRLCWIERDDISSSVIDQLFATENLQHSLNLMKVHGLTKEELRIIDDAVAQTEELCTLVQDVGLRLSDEEHRPLWAAISKARTARARALIAQGTADALAQAREDLKRTYELTLHDLKTTPAEQRAGRIKELRRCLILRALVELHAYEQKRRDASDAYAAASAALTQLEDQACLLERDCPHEASDIASIMASYQRILKIAHDVDRSLTLAETKGSAGPVMSTINGAVAGAEELFRPEQHAVWEERRDPYRHIAARARAARGMLRATARSTHALGQARKDLTRAYALESAGLETHVEVVARAALKARLTQMTRYLEMIAVVELRRCWLNQSRRIPAPDRLFTTSDVSDAFGLAREHGVTKGTFRIIDDAVSRAHRVLKLATSETVLFSAKEREPYENVAITMLTMRGRMLASVRTVEALTQARRDLADAYQLQNCQARSMYQTGHNAPLFERMTRCLRLRALVELRSYWLERNGNPAKRNQTALALRQLKNQADLLEQAFPQETRGITEAIESYQEALSRSF